VLEAARAFNAMQRRVADHIAERVQILAVISHDLQSPITRMRLRTDLLDDFALRQKFQSELTALRTLIEQGIDLARSAAPTREAFAEIERVNRQITGLGLIDQNLLDATEGIIRIDTARLAGALNADVAELSALAAGAAGRMKLLAGPLADLRNLGTVAGLGSMRDDILDLQDALRGVCRPFPVTRPERDGQPCQGRARGTRGNLPPRRRRRDGQRLHQCDAVHACTLAPAR
jgi:hypothetical protein